MAQSLYYDPFLWETQYTDITWLTEFCYYQELLGNTVWDAVAYWTVKMLHNFPFGIMNDYHHFFVIVSLVS